MRVFRCVKGIASSAPRWSHYGLRTSYSLRLFSSTPVCLVTQPISSSQRAPSADQWDPFDTPSFVHKGEDSYPETTKLSFARGTCPTESLDAAPKTATPEVAVLDASGNTISVTPIRHFTDLTNLPEWLAKGLQTLSYPTTTSIQGYTIPILDQGHDVVGLAPTGSGKTVAFAVPALRRFQPSPSGFPTIVVLAPTRELVQQTAKVFYQLSSGCVRICEAYGGAPREVQARRLHNGCDVLIACPGRLKDFLQNGDVTLEHMSFLVFDEADRLLDMGFKIQLDEILGYADASRPVQTMMWSATWPAAVEELARDYLAQDRYTIRSGTAGTGLQVNENIKQHILFADSPQERMDVLVSLIEKGTIDENTAKMMIFVERQTDTENTAQMLGRRLGIHARSVGVVHGGMHQRQRDYIMNNFKESRTRILIATDVASRGLDFPDVTCVVNFIAPKNIDSYCHRIGRTGRAGRTGDSFTFIGRSDGSLAKDLVGYLQKCGMVVPQQLINLAERYTQAEEERHSRRPWNTRARRGDKRQQWDKRAVASRDSGW